MRWNSRARAIVPALAAALVLIPLRLLLFSQNPAQPAPANPPVTAPPQPAKPAFLVMIDPAHGGNDEGASLSRAMPEKDVNLAFARRLRQELNMRGVQAALVRDGDVTLSLDQRASVVNSFSPALYLSIHTASEGTGMVLYTALLPSSGDNDGRFINWRTAQSAALLRSRSTEQQILAGIQKMGFPVRSLVAPLRPLNNVAIPAMAVVVAPT